MDLPTGYERLFTILNSEIAHAGSTGEIGIFRQTLCFLNSAGTQIDGHQRFGPCFTDPFHIFMQTNMIGIDGFPSQFQPRVAFFARTEPIQSYPEV